MFRVGLFEIPFGIIIYIQFLLGPTCNKTVFIPVVENQLGLCLVSCVHDCAFTHLQKKLLFGLKFASIAQYTFKLCMYSKKLSAFLLLASKIQRALGNPFFGK